MIPIDGFLLCIPTYRRPDLVERLLQDLSQQSVGPEQVVVLDGEGGSPELRTVLEEIACDLRVPVGLVPSTRANLPFQRMVGWLVAKELKANRILYLDDDLRIAAKGTIAELIQGCLDAEPEIIGATAKIQFGDLHEGDRGNIEADLRKGSTLIGTLSRLVGGGAAEPGSIKPVGHRSPPDCQTDSGWATVQWLQGGVMAFKVKALSRDCFPNTLLALYERRMGKGEDTIISRSVLPKGKLAYSCRATFQHPNTDSPQAYDANAWRLGLVVASSRRYLCDRYSGLNGPRFRDRVSLVKHYIGGTLVAVTRAVFHPGRATTKYAFGFMVGAALGLARSPSAECLTPEVDWDREAQLSLDGLEWLGQAIG